MPDQSCYHRGSVDSHCHLISIEEKGLDVDGALVESLTGGMGGILDVGILPATLALRVERFGDNPIVRFSSGIHPSNIERSDREAQIAVLADQISAGKLVAVGEIGLDHHWDTGSRSDQVELFERQVEMAVGSKLPVIVHNREADEDTLEVLRRFRPSGVMHCFSQDIAHCRRCLDLGMYISFGGNLTFKNSPLRGACGIVPSDRLLVETDSPYLSPQPVRGRANHPGHLGFTIDCMSEIKHMKAGDVAAATAANASRLFGVSSWLAASP